MRDSFVHVRVRTTITPTDAESHLTDDQISTSIQRAAEDAVFGTFGDPARDPVRDETLRPEIDPPQLDRRGASAEVDFTLGLSPKLFPISSGGLQHLVGVLSSDAFPSETVGCRWSGTEVTHLRLPGGMRDEIEHLFRPGRDSVALVRERFRLADNQPLLAFSYKPRVGFAPEDAAATISEVTKGGFDLVEFDTRNLASADETLEVATRMAEAATERRNIRSDIARVFAPNLSQRVDIAVATADRWIDTCRSIGTPPVVKVDGGLDGLSTIQALRARSFDPDPLITCYPLLRGLLTPGLGRTGWVELLARSGADIIYPGGRPEFFNESRPIWAEEAQAYIRATRWYDRVRTDLKVVPTIAGGVHPGHLHVAYELMGPDVAYFLGGAVSLHPDGPGAGARLCYEILAEARERADKARSKGRLFADDLPAALMGEIRRYPLATGNAFYIPPRDVFDPERAKGPVPDTWYRRDAGR